MGCNQCDFVKTPKEHTSAEIQCNAESIQVYLVMYITLIFFVLLNFLLAIIVDSFSEHKVQVKDVAGEKNFFVDLALVYWQRFLARKNRWPSHEQLLGELRAQEQVLLNAYGSPVLSQREFRELNAFASQSVGQSFFIHYASYYAIGHLGEPGMEPDEADPAIEVPRSPSHPAIMA